MRTSLLTATALLGLCAPSLAVAQPTTGEDDVHGTPEPIVISAPYVRELDILAGTSVLGGDELQRALEPQIGDTLAALPGVSSTSFSPGAARPVLRGFQGARVRVLTDGIGAIDASSTSADHAVTLDPLTAERIEVLHGPAVLLYGSQAIGGAVNIIDRRIPRTIPDEPVHVDAIAGYASASDTRSLGASVDVPLGGMVVAHVDGSYRQSDDVEVGGFVLSEPLREELLAEAAAEGGEEGEELAEQAALRGTLPNSYTETYTGGAGLSIINERGQLGFSVSYYDTVYGVPGRPGTEHAHGHEEEHDHEHEHEHEHEEEHDHGGDHEEEHGAVPVSIDLEQLRADMRGELELNGALFETLRTRVGFADYTHTEFEGDEVGTVFDTQGVEGRLELVQTDRGGWRGVVGGQFFVRDFSAVGAEAFVPPNVTEQVGVFALQEFELGNLQLEAAGRYENSNVRSDTVGVERSFDAFSGAVGVAYEPAEALRIGITGSRAVRAPSAEELFSNGPHIATQAFEIGDPTLATEKSWGAEAYVRASAGPVALSASVYGTWFDDYIYEVATGAEEDGLPIFQYRQGDARYIGFEVEGSAELFEAGGVQFVADGVADYVRATLDDAGPVPRIPPLRLLGGLEAQTGPVDGRVEVEWVDDQTRTAAYELPTDGHTLVNASIAWRPFGEESSTTLLLAANNIFDVDVRRHASFTKDFVPLAGRDFSVSARVSF